MSRKRWRGFGGRNCRRGERRAGKLQYLNKAATWIDLMGFHAVSLFVHLKNNRQMPNKLMTTKKQSELGLLRQVAIKEDKHNSYIPSRNSTEKQQMMESTPQLKVQTQFKGHQLKTATGNL